MRASAIAALIALGSCKGGEQAPATEHGERAAPAEHEDRDTTHGGAAHPEPERIKIAPDMMRDLRVTTGKAQTRTAGETISALGELHVNEDAYTEIAAPVAARVARILAKPGDKVAAGQTLALLNSPELAQSNAEVGAAKARLDVARGNAERKRALAADRLIPEREKIEAEAALSEAEAAYAVATSTLRKYGGAAGDTALALKSPIAGTVIDRTIVMGQLADPSKTLFRVGDLSTLWLIAHVFERDSVRVQVDRKAVATFAALPGKSTEAVIRSVGHEVDAASRTVAVRLDVPNAEGMLRPGMSATASIPLGEAGGAPVVVVPAAAVQRVGASWAVFLPRGAGAFEARPIGRGRDLSGEVEVLTGLSPGEEVVIEGAFLLKAEADKARGGAAEHED
jgi:cobalt-zinc-cadmium efflux system membrane fusion protein